MKVFAENTDKLPQQHTYKLVFNFFFFEITYYELYFFQWDVLGSDWWTARVLYSAGVYCHRSMATVPFYVSNGFNNLSPFVTSHFSYNNTYFAYMVGIRLFTTSIIHVWYTFNVACNCIFCYICRYIVEGRYCFTIAYFIIINIHIFTISILRHYILQNTEKILVFVSAN